MPDQHSIPEEVFSRRTAMRPNKKTWLKHSLLLVATLFTSTAAGVLKPFGLYEFLPDVNPQSWTELLQVIPTIPYIYFQLVSEVAHLLATDSNALGFGLSFSVSLLIILTAHEAGHYIACRIYKVDATLPYFIPTPPLIGPAGTLGAFIKIVSPMPSRKAVFDIGVAGPIAGFIALIPFGILAIATMEYAKPVTLSLDEFRIVFSDPLLMKFFAFVSGLDLSAPVKPNPFYAATWIGLLVTALNLIPSGQLDGGHAVYAVFGEKVHRWTGRIAFVAMALLSGLGMYFFSSPSGLLIAVILAVMMRVKHPQPLSDAPLDPKRKLVAVLTLIIFILCFVPFPIKLN